MAWDGLASPSVTLCPGCVASRCPSVGASSRWPQRPEPVLARLRQVALEMNTEPAFAPRLRQLGFDPMPLDGDAFRSFVVEDLARWRETAAATNIQLA